MSAVTHKRRRCDRCGAVGKVIEMVRSRHTGARYCRDVSRCDARVARRKKTEQVSA